MPRAPAEVGGGAPIGRRSGNRPRRMPTRPMSTARPAPARRARPPSAASSAASTVDGDRQRLGGALAAEVNARQGGEQALDRGPRRRFESCRRSRRSSTTLMPTRTSASRSAVHSASSGGRAARRGAIRPTRSSMRAASSRPFWRAVSLGGPGEAAAVDGAQAPRGPAGPDRTDEAGTTAADPHPGDDRDGGVGEGGEVGAVAALERDHGRAVDRRAHRQRRRPRLRHEDPAEEERRRQGEGQHLEAGGHGQDREQVGRRPEGADDGRVGETEDEGRRVVLGGEEAAADRRHHRGARPSGHPVAIQIALVRRMERKTPTAESRAMPWSR